MRTRCFQAALFLALMSSLPSHAATPALQAPDTAKAPASTSSAAASSAGAQSVGSLNFTPCTLKGLDMPQMPQPQVNALCSTLKVAENPSQPEGRQIDLQIAWVPAAGKSSAADPIVLLAGGPGQSALESWPMMSTFLHAASQKRPVLLIDQRGTGGSNRLECLPADGSSTIEMTAAQAEALIRQCPKQLSDRADVRYYTTTDAVRDLEAVRAAMALPRLNLLGISYGTRVAQHYARQYPQHVRSIVLDSAVPNGRSIIEGATGVNNTLKLLADHCARHPSCKPAVGDIKASLNAMLKRLDENPVTVNVQHPRTGKPVRYRLTRDALESTVQMLLYTSQTAVALPIVLAQSAQGKHDLAAALALQIEDSVTQMIPLGAYYAAACVEDIGKTPAPAMHADDPLRMNLLIQTMRKGCEQWPSVKLPEDFDTPLRGDIPTLSISGEWDPVTSAEFGREAIAGMSKARHLLLKGQGHSAVIAGCMPTLLARFLDDPNPAALNTRCLNLLQPPAIPM